MWKEITDLAQIKELEKAGVLYWKTANSTQWRPCAAYSKYRNPVAWTGTEIVQLHEYSMNILCGTVAYAIQLEE